MEQSPDCLYCHKLAGLTPESPEVVWHFPQSVVLLGPWQFYHGYCILVSRIHATELSQLGKRERSQFLEEMCVLALAIEKAFQPKKLNYELLGNLVPHLHWHLFPRYAGDPEVLQPVWLALEKAKTDARAEQCLQAGPVSPQQTVTALRAQLRALGCSSAVGLS